MSLSTWSCRRRAAADQRLASRIGVVIGGTAFAQLVMLLVAPLLARIYSPVDFGELAALTAISLVLGNFASLKLDAAIPIAADDDEAAALTMLCCVITVTLVAVMAVAWVLGGPNLTPRSERSHSFFIFAACVSVLLVSLWNVLTRLHVRTENYGKLGTRSAVQGIGQVGGQLVLAPLVASLNGMLGGQLIGRVLAMAPDWRLLGRMLRKARRRHLLPAITRHRALLLLTSWTSLIGSIGLHLPMLLIGALYSMAALGHVALAQRILTVPVQLFAQSSETLVQGAVARLVRSGDKHRILRTVGATVWPVAAPVVLLAAASAPLAPSLFGFVFGDRWIVSATVYQLLVVPTCLQIVALPFGATLNTIGLHGRRAVWDVLRAAVTVLPVAVSAMLGADVLTAVLVFACAQSAAYLTLLGISIHALVHYAGSHAVWTRMQPRPLYGSARIEDSGDE